MVSTLRLNVLRVVYLMIFVFVTMSFWPDLFHRNPKWTLMSGVARCFFAALAPFVLAGLRYPLKMLPFLLFEFVWKTMWVAAIGIPIWLHGPLDADNYETMKACLMGVVLFPAVIPWRYVFDTYFRAPGDRWRGEGGGAVHGAVATAK